MPSELLASTVASKIPYQTANRISLDGFAKLADMLIQLDGKVTELCERFGLCATELSYNRPSDMLLPWGEWFTKPGINWTELVAGDGTLLARIPLETDYPDVAELLTRAKMLREVVCELIELFQRGGTKKANELSAIFLRNGQPITPTSTTTYINMLAAVARKEP